jgi:hypothetical protein
MINCPAIMITRFGGVGPVTGIHLTRLRADGTGKADVEKPKIMLGPSQGEPIIVHDNPERLDPSPLMTISLAGEHYSAPAKSAQT